MNVASVFVAIALAAALVAPPAASDAGAQRICNSYGQVCGCASHARDCSPVCHIVPRLSVCPSSA